MGKLRERIYEAREHGVEESTWLQEVGAIVVDEEIDDYVFATEFADLIRDHVQHFVETGVGLEEVATIFDAEPGEWVREETDRDYTAYWVVHQIFKWPSEDALILDAAIEAALADLTDRWNDEVPARQRHRIILALRGFQDDCFFCGGDVIFNDEPVDSCCEDQKVVTVHCDDCDRRFLEFTTGQVDSDELGQVVG